MRLELVFLPDAMDRVFAHALLSRQSASTPVCRTLGLALERGFNNASHVGFAVKRFAPSTWRNLPNATDSLLTDPPPPQSSRASLQFQFASDLLVRLSLRCPDNDLGTQHYLLGCRTGTEPLLQ